MFQFTPRMPVRERRFGCVYVTERKEAVCALLYMSAYDQAEVQAHYVSEHKRTNFANSPPPWSRVLLRN
jgi:hypothetical protein